MRRYVVAGLIIIGLALAVFAVRKPAQETVGRVKKTLAVLNDYTQAYDAFVAVTEALQVSTYDLHRITAEWEKDKGEIRALQAEITALRVEVVSMSTSIENPPEPPDKPPESLIECMDQIQAYQQIVVVQNNNVEILTAINLSQSIIIDRQEVIIHKQDTYISEFQTLIQQHNRRALRNITIATGAGILIGLIL